MYDRVRRHRSNNNNKQIHELMCIVVARSAEQTVQIPLAAAALSALNSCS